MGTLLLAATILVSAASSLTDVLNELAKRYEALTGTRVQVNVGSSNTLARQITQGAPVDLFISADDEQMNILERAGQLVPATRVPLVSNRLVVIVPATSALQVSSARDLANAAVKRVAMANPGAVPAGVYARRWLEHLRLWKTIEPKVIPLPTVRAALAAVREGRADAGVVYATDARNERGIRVAFTPAPHDVGVIVYPAAVIAGPRQAEAERFLSFLRSREAAAAFGAAGFRPPVHP
jgi:molybdate transport system substrate-binding protein